MVNPQLPARAVVTPCSGDGVRAPSQKTWASKWVCTSMNPGVTTLPVASMTLAASPGTSPIATTRSPWMPTSARWRVAPVPSITSPPRITRSSIRGPFRHLFVLHGTSRAPDHPRGAQSLHGGRGETEELGEHRRRVLAETGNPAARLVRHRGQLHRIAGGEDRLVNAVEPGDLDEHVVGEHVRVAHDVVRAVARRRSDPRIGKLPGRVHLRARRRPRFDGGTDDVVDVVGPAPRRRQALVFLPFRTPEEVGEPLELMAPAHLQHEPPVRGAERV